MRFEFKIQQYQTDAAESITRVFQGQPFDTGAGGNQAVALTDEALLANIRSVQQKNHVKQSKQMTRCFGRCSLDVEMETGTGKTYVYAKTMYELNRHYGWRKFIVVVPSIAIREGVKKFFEITQDHFMEQYGKKIRFSVYSSGSLNQIDAFAGGFGIHVMIINMQAFNASMKEGGRSRQARIIYEERDEFGSRRPIDVMKDCRPILILDEPQKMGGEATQKALQNFHPLFCLYFSATHRQHHDLIYVLDAADAFRQKLVKRMEVKGIETACKDDAAGGRSETELARIQIRETILSHMEKEEALFALGIKTLSLFFIDEVAKYRVYGENGEEQLGEYGKIFEEEYRAAAAAYRTGADTPYQRYLQSIRVETTHKGYFSIDKKGRAVNSSVKRGADFSDDISAYDLILKNKERLLSFHEPARFLFSHSALREGWDNPNVFQICALKESGSSVVKRQEIGRGLRLCVNQEGIRMDGQILGENLVHKINLLTVVVRESYKEFAADLQRQIREDLYERPVGDAGSTSSKRVLKEMIGNGSRTVFTEGRETGVPKADGRMIENPQNGQAVQEIFFDSKELIEKSVARINQELSVPRLTPDQMLFRRETEKDGGQRTAAYDLVGAAAQKAGLTRRTAAAILQGICPEKFAMFRIDPEEFIAQTARLIKEQRLALSSYGCAWRNPAAKD